MEKKVEFQPDVLELIELIEKKDLDWEGLLQLQNLVLKILLNKVADEE